MIMSLHRQACCLIRLSIQRYQELLVVVSTHYCLPVKETCIPVDGENTEIQVSFDFAQFKNRYLLEMYYCRSWHHHKHKCSFQDSIFSRSKFDGQKHSCGWSSVYRYCEAALIDPDKVYRAVDYTSQVMERLRRYDLIQTERIRHFLTLVQCMSDSLTESNHVMKGVANLKHDLDGRTTLLALLASQ